MITSNPDRRKTRGVYGRRTWGCIWIYKHHPRDAYRSTIGICAQVIKNKRPKQHPKNIGADTERIQGGYLENSKMKATILLMLAK